jgi:protein phosphatase
MLTAHGHSHPGTVRKINEDCWLSDPEIGLFIVADGMGGHNAGEVASQLAVDAIRGFLMRSREGDDFTWPYGIDPQLSYDANRLMTSLKLANRRVFKAGESRDEYTGMGTTVVAGLVEGSRLIFSGVGDSRIYSHVKGELSQITEDDSWVATVLGRERGLDRASLSEHPMRHVLTNVIGAREQTEMEVSERESYDGETLPSAPTACMARSTTSQSGSCLRWTPRSRKSPNGWSRRHSSATAATTSPPSWFVIRDEDALAWPLTRLPTFRRRQRPGARSGATSCSSRSAAEA